VALGDDGVVHRGDDLEESLQLLRTVELRAELAHGALLHLADRRNVGGFRPAGNDGMKHGSSSFMVHARGAPHARNGRRVSNESFE
jgi:hypothetical protein